jgi:hypothetical protein
MAVIETALAPRSRICAGNGPAADLGRDENKDSRNIEPLVQLALGRSPNRWYRQGGDQGTQFASDIQNSGWSAPHTADNQMKLQDSSRRHRKKRPDQ